MENQPIVLQLHPVLSIASVEDRFLKKFRFLKAWESLMHLDLFLTTYAQSVTALLCSGYNPITADKLRCLHSFRCIVTTSADLNHIDLVECHRRGIAIANAGDSFSENAADYAIGLFFDVFRQISAGDRYVRQGLWPIKGEHPLGSRVSIFFSIPIS
ncbi:glyoxylate/hydroxypyruvate reductase HPR3-like [Macadamia integrifolia]|uniref:glyoxylate/hydroxypyruvate reductase HPR3-like n=1 Tax=Macadamia integrifolia TaxID=60698 RepID=UPI001C4F522F|nr:glyoxylate/hydroxypyruvate reductase HPR3-like [Macadamia integrifolia]